MRPDAYAVYLHLGDALKEEKGKLDEAIAAYRKAIETAPASMRDEKALGSLPAAERDGWKKLWANVAALTQKAEGKK